MAAEKKEPKTRKLSIEQISLIRGLHEQGALGPVDIADEAGCSVDQVKYQIKKNGWVRGIRAEYYEEIARKAIEEELQTKAKEAADMKDAVRTKAVQLANIIEGRVVRNIQKTDAAGLSDATMLQDLKTLEIASRVIQNTFHTKRFALGMDKEEHTGDESDDMIQLLEMTADELDEIRSQQEAEFARHGLSDED